MTRAARLLVGAKESTFGILSRCADGTRFSLAMADLATAPLAGFDAVLPLTLEDHAALTARAARGERVPALLPSETSVRLCDDKLALNQRLIRRGLGHLVPPILPPDAPPPYILKRRRDAWGKNSRIVTSAEEAAAAATRPVRGWFRQTLVPGDREHALHVLMRGGRPVFHLLVTHETEPGPYVMGINQSSRGKSWGQDAALLKTLAPVLRSAGFAEGLCCIDFKMLDGRPQIFEVNPRFGSSLAEQPDAMLETYCAAVAGMAAA